MPSTTRTSRIVLRGTLCCLAWWVSSTLWAQTETAKQIVLLRSGRVLEAEVLIALDQWTLRFSSGAELRIDPDEIDLIGDNHRHLYQQLQQRTTREQLGQRVKIAQFCIRHDLLAEAEQEIQWLRQDGLEEAVATRLEARLEAAKKSASQPRATSPAPRAEALAAQASVPQSIRQPISSRNQSLSEQDLQEIDLESFATFVKYVQPHLLMGCSQAPCHGSQASNGFRLSRLEQGATPTRPMSEANYRVVEDWLTDRESNALLERALAIHGGQREPTWKADDLGARLLEAWGQAMASAEAQSGVALPTVRPVSFQSVIDGDAQATSAEAGDSMAMPQVTPLDPYDPELFNQQSAAKAASDPEHQAKRAGEPEAKLVPIDRGRPDERSPKALPDRAGERYPIELPPRQTSKKD